MKQQEKRKEILTYANIRRDLRRKLWAVWVNVAIVVLCSVLLVVLLFIDPEFLFETSSRYPLPGWTYFLVYPVCLYLTIKDAWLVACGFRRKPYMAKDTLISSEGDASQVNYYSWRSYYCTLHFNGYGDYQVPEKNYRWSKENAMTARGVDNLAFPGGEYYLVLSKPHSGKILLAYNAELFQLEGEEE